jgi:hypothetical protein
MRLGIKLLNIGATLNNHKRVSQVQIAKGETCEIAFQLVDLDQDGLRYIPQAGATVEVKIARIDEVGFVNGERTFTNKTITRPAAGWADDRSVWRVPLTTTDTESLVSNSIQVTLTEGSEIKRASVQQAIRIIS